MNSFPVIAGIKKDPGPIPELHPPRGEISVDIPEKAILGLALFVAFGVLILGKLLRKPPVQVVLPPEHPASVARHALSELTPGMPPQVIATTASQTIRSYARTAFALGDDAMTTSEFCARYATHPLTDSVSTSALHSFLTDCERAQFAPEGAGFDPQLVDRAYAMIEYLEHQRNPAAFAQAEAPTAS